MTELWRYHYTVKSKQEVSNNTHILPELSGINDDSQQQC